MLRGANIDSKTGDRRRKVAFWGKLGEFCSTVLTFISRFIDGLKSIAKPSSPNRYKRWSQNTAHISVFYFNTNLSTHYQLHGEAKTLRMRTAVSPGQWQPWLRACVLQAFALPFFTNTAKRSVDSQVEYWYRPAMVFAVIFGGEWKGPQFRLSVRRRHCTEDIRNYRCQPTGACSTHGLRPCR